MSTEFVQISTTTALEADARRLAELLVRRRLAACVQVSGPIHSTYWWQGEVEEAQEWICVAKSRGSLLAAVEALLADEHPYEVPELVATPLVGGGAAYLRWLDEELSRG